MLQMKIPTSLGCRITKSCKIPETENEYSKMACALGAQLCSPPLKLCSMVLLYIGMRYIPGGEGGSAWAESLLALWARALAKFGEVDTVIQSQ